jgi:hypothetical protein
MKHMTFLELLSMLDHPEVLDIIILTAVVLTNLGINAMTKAFQKSMVLKVQWANRPIYFSTKSVLLQFQPKLRFQRAQNLHMRFRQQMRVGHLS